MALQLNQEFETPQGISVPATYWRWVGLGIDIPSMKARGTLYAYASPQAFLGGKQPVGQREYEITGADFVNMATALETGSSGISELVYSFVVQSDPYFAEAVQAD